MSKFTQRFTQITVAVTGESVISETATRITIEDHAAGEFVSIDQPNTGGRILISPDEWPQIRDAVNHLVSSCISEDGE